MERAKHFYRIGQLLNERKLMPQPTFRNELEISHATFKSDLEYMRDSLNVPIIWDRDVGDRFEKHGVAYEFELPGVW